MTPLPVEADSVTETAVPPGDDEMVEENGRSPSWLIIGLILLSVLMIVGVIFFVVRMRQA